MARKNSFISSLVFLIDVLSKLFIEIKALGGNEESFYTLKSAKKIKEIAKIIIGEIKTLFPGNNYLKLLCSEEGLVLDACDDTYVIEKADDTFTSVDSDFRNYGANEKGPKTEATHVGVYELQKDAMFTDFFNSVTKDLDSMCFTHSQIKQFVKKYKNWLRTDGYANFFLFKSNGKFFVANVHIDTDGGAWVGVSRFESVRVWGASRRRRVFLPALVV